MKINKGDLIRIIRKRLESEFRKHKTLNWPKISAIKIVNMLHELNLLKDIDGLEPLKEEQITKLDFKTPEELTEYLSKI